MWQTNKLKKNKNEMKIIKKKRNRLTDKENKLVDTNEEKEGGEGQYRDRVLTCTSCYV